MILSNATATALPRLASPDAARGYLGSAFRASVDFLHQRGCAAQVAERVSDATLELIARPPFPFVWIPALHMDELHSALCAVAGREACVDLGVTGARKLSGSVFAPVLRMATALFGNTPVTLFQNLERFYTLVLRGMSFEYEILGPRSGLVLAQAGGAHVPLALFDVTRGNLAYLFELCGASGTVSEPQDVRCGSRKGEARYQVEWI